MNPKRKGPGISRTKVQVTPERSSTRILFADEAFDDIAEHPHCALPEHYFDRYWEKSAFDGRNSLTFERYLSHPDEN